MLRMNRERGSARAASIVVGAVVLLGGAAYVMTGGTLPSAIALQNPQRPGASFNSVEPASVRQAQAPKAEPTGDVAKAKKGEIIQYRDEYGQLRYRMRDPVVGKTGNGLPLYFNVEFRPSDTPLEKAPQSALNKADLKRKPKPVPRGEAVNGKLGLKPAGGGSSGGK
jgi:hypothetical protein